MSLKRDHNIIGIMLVAGVGMLAFYRGAKKVEQVILPNNQVDTMARTAWGEARGEGATGMQAVLNVIMNRVKKGGWWGATPAEVCKKKSQFSCWNASDPNYAKLLAVNDNDESFRSAKMLAESAYAGTLPDITGGATNYVNLSALKSVPSWVKNMTKTAQIGNHTFYV